MAGARRKYAWWLAALPQRVVQSFIAAAVCGLGPGVLFLFFVLFPFLELEPATLQ